MSIGKLTHLLTHIQEDKVLHDDLLKYLEDVSNPQFMCIYNILQMKLTSMELYEEVEAFLDFHVQNTGYVNDKRIDPDLQIHHLVRSLENYIMYKDFPLILEDELFAV